MTAAARPQGALGRQKHADMFAQGLGESRAGGVPAGDGKARLPAARLSLCPASPAGTVLLSSSLQAIYEDYRYRREGLVLALIDGACSS